MFLLRSLSGAEMNLGAYYTNILAIDRQQYLRVCASTVICLIGDTVLINTHRLLARNHFCNSNHWYSWGFENVYKLGEWQQHSKGLLTDL